MATWMVLIVAWDRPLIAPAVASVPKPTRVAANRRPSTEVEFRVQGNHDEVVPVPLPDHPAAPRLAGGGGARAGPASVMPAADVDFTIAALRDRSGEQEPAECAAIMATRAALAGQAVSSWHEHARSDLRPDGASKARRGGVVDLRPLREAETYAVLTRLPATASAPVCRRNRPDREQLAQHADRAPDRSRGVECAARSAATHHDWRADVRRAHRAGCSLKAGASTNLTLVRAPLPSMGSGHRCAG